MSFSISWLTFNHARILRDAFILLRLPEVSSPQTENSLNKCLWSRSRYEILCEYSCRVDFAVCLWIQKSNTPPSQSRSTEFDWISAMYWFRWLLFGRAVVDVKLEATATCSPCSVSFAASSGNCSIEICLFVCFFVCMLFYGTSALVRLLVR